MEEETPFTTENQTPRNQFSKDTHKTYRKFSNLEHSQETQKQTEMERHPIFREEVPQPGKDVSSP